jgi:hypothetical protein
MANSNATSAGAFAYDQLPPALKGRAMDPFIYNCEILAIPASSSSTGTVSINNDADFLIVSIVGVVTDANNANPLTNVPATVLITDNGSGRAISNIPTAYNNAIGTTLMPYYLDYPKYLARSTTLSVQYNSLEAVIRNVRIAFRGFKIFSQAASAS